MLFERFEDRGLSQYSYIVACEGAGVAAIVDPRRDVDVYLEYAAARRLRITHVLETHIHADFASGARELCARTDATLCLSAHDAGEAYESSLAHTPLHDGDAVTLGRVRLEAMHTPGHTPEHVSFLVFDTARAAGTPQILLSGDFLFVGSLGRPDLIGVDATRGLAARLYDSIRRTDALPDGLEIHPGHGAGSMCGAGMSARPMSTLGFERLANPLLSRSLTRDDFVSRVLAHLPPFPPYYRRMKLLNAEGAAVLPALPGQRALHADEVAALIAAGGVVVDLRDQVAYGRGHVPGSFGIGAGQSLSTWASWVVPYDTPIVLVAPRPSDVPEAVRALVRVGLDDVRGYLEGGMAAWGAAGHRMATLEQISPEELLARLPALRVLDVRSDEEWKGGHPCGADHVMGGYVPEQAAALAAGTGPIAVVCATGYRSTVVASVLQRAGAREVLNVTGGMGAWRDAGLPQCTD